MTRRAHKDNELKPPMRVLAALDRWLDENGLRRVALAQPLGTPPAQVSRMFAGRAFLSAAHRRAIERFTEGAITAAMLEGKAPPPTTVAPKPRAPVEVPAEPEGPAEPVAAPRSAPQQTAEDAERIVDGLAARAMPAAFRLIIEQMVKGKTESERRRCAEILIEHLRGKAKQYEKREQLIQPVSDEALLRKLREIEANLTGLPVDAYGRVIREPQAPAPKGSP